MNLGEKIMNLRKDAGYSQEELASLIGVSRQSVSSGNSMMPHPILINCLKFQIFFLSVVMNCFVMTNIH